MTTFLDRTFEREKYVPLILPDHFEYSSRCHLWITMRDIQRLIHPLKVQFRLFASEILYWDVHPKNVMDNQQPHDNAVGMGKLAKL